MGEREEALGVWGAVCMGREEGCGQGEEEETVGSEKKRNCVGTKRVAQTWVWEGHSVGGVRCGWGESIGSVRYSVSVRGGGEGSVEEGGAGRGRR